MTAHAPAAHGHDTHGSHGGDSVFTTAKNWFASKSPTKLNPLSAIDEVGHNLVRGIIKSTTSWVADICNPLGAAAMNGASLFSPKAYKEHGFKNIPKSLSGIGSHILDSVNNLIAGSTVRLFDHAYTKTITDSAVDITSGTTDRVPGVGKFAGNTVKGVNVIPAAPIRFLARAWEMSFDRLSDWMKSFATVKAPARHLTTATASAGGGHDAHH